MQQTINNFHMMNPWNKFINNFQNFIYNPTLFGDFPTIFPKNPINN